MSLPGAIRRRLRSVKDYGHLARLLSGLGASPAARARIAALTFLVPIKQRSRHLAGRWVTLDLQYAGRTLRWYVSDQTELMALADVLVHEQYKMPDSLSPRTIVDLGSNVGGSILYFASRYPDARIVGLEPDPATFRKLEANVSGLANVEVRCVAVGDRDGESAFYPSARTWASSLKPTFATEPGITVPVRTLDTLLDELGEERVDLIKLDIEGSEYDVLRAFRGMPRRTGALIGELHRFLPEVYDATVKLLDRAEAFDVTYQRDGRDHLFRAVARADVRGGGSAPAD